MRASVVDLRYKMRDVLRALRRNETVDILYHGKVEGTIFPARSSKIKKGIQAHPFFGMHAGYKKETVKSVMEKLRGGRYRAI